MRFQKRENKRPVTKMQRVPVNLIDNARRITDKVNGNVRLKNHRITLTDTFHLIGEGLFQDKPLSQWEKEMIIVFRKFMWGKK